MCPKRVSIFLQNLNYIYMITYAKVISKRSKTKTIQYNTEFAGRAGMGHFKLELEFAVSDL